VKGHKVLLQAFAAASAQVEGLHLHVIGQGDQKSALNREAARLGIERLTTFHGHVEHDRLAAYYRGASYCVLSSYFESHGMVVLEAAGCGRLTIGSAVGSSPDFCPAEYLNQPGDSSALATNMQQVATNTELRKQVARKAGEKAHNGYTLKQSVQAHENLYRICRSRS
jgi:glycosyltransferase involved in cell wall biosynthesis